MIGEFFFFLFNFIVFFRGLTVGSALVLLQAFTLVQSVDRSVRHDERLQVLQKLAEEVVNSFFIFSH